MFCFLKLLKKKMTINRIIIEKNKRFRNSDSVRNPNVIAAKSKSFLLPLINLSKNKKYKQDRGIASGCVDNQREYTIALNEKVKINAEVRPTRSLKKFFPDK